MLCDQNRCTLQEAIGQQRHMKARNTDRLTERSQLALEDAILQGALKRATDTFIERRRDAVATAPDLEGLRTRARQSKNTTINNPHYYL